MRWMPVIDAKAPKPISRPARTFTPAWAASRASLKYPLPASMPLRRARSSIVRMVMAPIAPPVVASSGARASEGPEFFVIGVSSQEDGLWLGGVAEGRGGPDGEHDTRRAAR